jgi:hypothetical protein
LPTSPQRWQRTVLMPLSEQLMPLLEHPGAEAEVG